jgi:PTH1 family peptidyl-tRNA hydrolase
VKLIVGLGNVGATYTNTRHNIGFMIADQLARDLDATWKTESKFKAEIAPTELNGQKIILTKPHTLMNLSGEAVQRIMQFYKIPPTDVWAIFDELDVPFGRFRIRHGGGGGGHQGVNSLIQHIGADFVRFRTGISLNNRAKEPSEVYVLKPFASEEREHLPKLIAGAAELIRKQLAREKPEESTFSLL